MQSKPAHRLSSTYRNLGGQASHPWCPRLFCIQINLQNNQKKDNNGGNKNKTEAAATFYTESTTIFIIQFYTIKDPKPAIKQIRGTTQSITHKPQPEPIHTTQKQNLTNSSKTFSRPFPIQKQNLTTHTNTDSSTIPNRSRQTTTKSNFLSFF